MAVELLKSLNELWLKRIKVARKFRKDHFEPIANKIDRYYHTRKAWLLLEDATGASPEDVPFRTAKPYHRVSVAKTGEFVRLMLPYIFFQVPVRRVTPRARRVPDEVTAMILQSKGIPPPPMPSPMLERGRSQSYLAEYLLNYAADDATYNLRGESRKACQEALIAGRGILWHELVQTPNGFFPGSFFESWRNVLFDPDYDEIRQGNYLFRRKRLPIWQIAEQFQLPYEKVKAQAKSFDQFALEEAGQSPTSTEDSKDLGEYWEVYSRMGLGHRLCYDAEEELRQKLEAVSSQFDDNVFLAVMEGMDHPLNMNPDSLEAMTEADLKDRLAWPIKFFGDYQDPWPGSVLDFYPDGIYPKPPLEDAIPLQAFLDFAFYYLMDRIKQTSRNIVLCDQSAAKKLKEALESGFDTEIVELIGKTPDLAAMIYQMKFDPVNTDLWQIITAVNSEWENSTGINMLIRGGQGGSKFRSAEDASIHQTNAQIRPDDLRDCVQEWQGRVARKEHVAQRLTMKTDVALYFGEPEPSPENPVMGLLTEEWMSSIATDDPWMAAQELAVVIEGSTGRRRDKQAQLATMKELGQILVPAFLQERMTTGDPSQINAYLSELFDALDTPDPGRFLFPPTQPPMLPQGEESPPEEAPPEEPPPVPEEMM